MARAVVLLAERDETTRRAIAGGLRRDGYDLFEAAHPLWYPRCPDDAEVWLGVVEAGGPFGYEPIAEARRRGAGQVLALVNRLSGFDVAGALDFGADDGVVKPVQPDELLARVRAARRRTTTSTDTLHVGHLTVVPENKIVTFRGEQVLLARREFDLLVRLARAGTDVVLRGELLDRLWGYRGAGADASLSEHVRRLRAKFRDVGAHGLIVTVRGAGYCIDAATSGGGDESHLGEHDDRRFEPWLDRPGRAASASAW